MGLAKTFLAIGISVVFAVFIAYGLFVVYEPPHNTCWEDFNCGKLTAVCYGEDPETYEKVARRVPIIEDEAARECVQNITKTQEYKQCLQDQEQCNEEHEAKEYIHARNSFFVLAIIAIAVLLAGLYLSYLEGIGSGFLGGGVLLILWSLIYTQAFWTEWNKYVKLFALFVVLVILIYVGYKKIEQKTKKR